jgi:hypothetical protein
MYGDFQCPYCTAAYPIVKRIRDQLVGRLHAGSFDAASLIAALEMQGRS